MDVIVRINRLLLHLTVSFVSMAHMVAIADDEIRDRATRLNLIKAAYLYNFFSFIDWPEDAESVGSERLFRIAVIGNDDLANSFEPITHDRIDGRGLSVDSYDRLPSDINFEDIHIIYVDRSRAKDIDNVLQATKNLAVLTVSDIVNFVENGGMIQFVEHANNVRFRVHKGALDRVGLRARSQIYRIALEVMSSSHR